MIDWLDQDEERRAQLFPVVRKRIFLAHAGVTSLPQCVADAVIDYTRSAAEEQQEYAEAIRLIRKTREVSAELIGAGPDEIALLGPTSLGLSLFAHGLEWKEGDEIVCYADDYPANVYPWMDLERRGVRVRFLQPDTIGKITPDLVQSALSSRTRLVALASCNFLSGYRIDVDAIGELVHSHGALFSLDAIQTLGAFDTKISQVDFLSADAHKWLLGPMAIGIVYVRKERFAELHPMLIGAANVRAPNFVAQNQIQFRETAERYEPGVLNIAGVVGMKAAIEMILECGLPAISERILALKARLVEGLSALGFEFLGPVDGPRASGITTAAHPKFAAARIFEELNANNVSVSPRFDRAGNGYIRYSPHFYNTFAEIDHVVALVAKVVR